MLPTEGLFMKPITLALATLLLSSAAAAAAQTDASVSAPAPEPTVAAQGRGTGQVQTPAQASTDPQERRICRRLDTTGSRNARPTCMTVRQWRQYDRP